ncbi:hypothetical protein [Streptomyces sp. NPDC058657]|uniref:hypothetical protein n=1 Tax=Streptomyces sp. NPDC058657 TaxID=3346579 RepID=UPI003666DE98
MISPPELVGGPPRPPRTRIGEWLGEGRARPWLGALGGAVAASALWAGGLYALDRDGGPDQRGYRLAWRSCEKVPLTSLRERLGERDTTTDSEDLFEDPALNRLECRMSMRPPVRRSGEYEIQQRYQVTFHVEQHRRTDPGPEIEALLKSGRRGWGGFETEKLTPVKGLGDRAYFVNNYRSGPQLELVVQDGGVLLTLQLFGDTEVNGDGPPGTEPPDDSAPDLSGTAGRVEAAMREAMAVLKR